MHLFRCDLQSTTAKRSILLETQGPMSHIARHLLLIAVFTLGIIASLPTHAAQSSIKVVVNGDIITSYDIAQRTRLLPLFGVKGGEKKAIDELIDDLLKFQEANRLGLRVPDARVDAVFASMGQERKLNAQRLAQELGKIGINADTMKRWIKAQIIWRELVQAKVRKEGQVKTEDIMSAMLERGGPDKAIQTEYRLQQIIFVVPSGSSSSYAAQRRREAESFRLRFKSCDDSLEQAKVLKDVVVRDLGRRETSELRGPQGDEIAKTPLGKTTRPLPSNNGIELIAVCSKRDFESDSALRAEVETQLQLEQAQEKGKDYLEDLRDRAIIQYR
jgi:peptidyl-prolyl cis-trans isomerase SurA